MKITTSIILLLLSINAFSQTEGITHFYPLTPIDTIYNSEEVTKSKRIDSLNTTAFFFTYVDPDYKSGLLLNKKSNDKWIRYVFNPEMFSSSNMSIDNFRLVDEKYVFIQVTRFPSGVCSNIFGFLNILNIDTCKTIMIRNYHQQECYDKNARVSSQSECKTTTTLRKGVLTLKRSGINDRLDCTESAEYKIENDSIIKIKYYLDSVDYFYPIVCDENYKVCTGMSLDKLKKLFDNSIFKQAPLYEYYYDTENNGLEICSKEGKTELVVSTNGNTVTGICFISPKYQFNGINTQTKISDILNKYPNSKLILDDLLTDFEFIYIDELKIKLVFRTGHNNLIGKYDNGLDYGTRKVKNPNATPDFIMI